VVRRRGQGRPAHEQLGLNHTQLSNRRYSGKVFAEYDLARAELSSWRCYYLDPRDAMRWPMPPMEVDDIGVSGEMLAPFLYGLKQRHREAFLQFQRVVRSVIPSIGEVDVDLDARRGTLDVQIRQAGTLYSSRAISEGTLRVLALCAIAVNPTPAPLIAYEEPENGVHPARLELVAGILASLAARRRSQVLITTHSPSFASTALRLARQGDLDVGLFNVSVEAGASRIGRFDVAGPLFDDQEIKEALTTRDEAQLFEAMLRRGWLDGLGPISSPRMEPTSASARH
jgi:predicted ATPase